jgi:hypothetical protein
MEYKWFLHICFLNFTDTNIDTYKRDDDYDHLLKIQTVFDNLNDVYKKNYNPSGYLAMDKVTVKFKERAIFRQYIPKKT